MTCPLCQVRGTDAAPRPGTTRADLCAPCLEEMDRLGPAFVVATRDLLARLPADLPSDLDLGELTRGDPANAA